MKEKMISFLNSIKIDNIDSFDIDFEMVSRNRFNHEQIDMIIVKDTPWKYNFLREFQDALINNVNYPYFMRFSYKEKPSFDNLVNLFNDWHQTIYRLPPDITLLDGGEGIINIEYDNEDIKSKNELMIKDFKDFLSFITYDFTIKESVKPQEEKVIISEKKLAKIIEKASDEASIAIEESKDEAPINDRDDVKEMIEQEKAANNAVMEDFLLKQKIENTKQMIKERERARLNRHGDYKHIPLIDSISSNSGNIDIDGYVFYKEVKDFGGKKRLNLGVNDKAGGCIFVSMTQNNQVNDELVDALNKKTRVRVRGVAYVDDYTKNLTIRGHYIDLLEPDQIEKEPFEKNRVELHLHSLMSTQDAVTSMMDYCALAKSLGHTAMAITDHGCVQGFPDAQAAGKKHNIKILYGCEFYMVDDKLSYIKNPSDIELNKANYVVLDLETTGLSARYNEIIEFGAVRVEKGMEVGHIDILVKPKVPVSEKISKITNITNDLLKDKPTIEEAMPKILDFCKDAILVTHNADFDISFLQEALVNMGREKLPNPVIDTLSLSRYLFPDARNHTLGSLCHNMDVTYDEESAHRADYDAHVLNEVWQPLLAMLTKDNLSMKHKELEHLEYSSNLLTHIRPVHCIALAKNKQGLKDLYKLVSISNIDYLADVPKLPRKEISKLRENLLIGSACFNGEIYRTAQYYNKETLEEAMKFYDYIEVQPPENYSFLVNMGDINEEDTFKYIKDIIDAADAINKPVVATGDVHYLSREEKIFRDVYIDAPSVGKKAHPLNPYKRSKMERFSNPDQHYRTTQEMLDIFSFLGEEKAKEIVIDNTNMIADQIEPLLAVPNDKLFTPKIENCENMLRDMCYQTAVDWYSPDNTIEGIPTFIKERLDTELNGIITNGYSVIYYIAHKIVKKANDDGFIVGSRGSVGSSLVATMCGITEVNALPPHYRCPHCKHLEWTKETMPEYASGYDLPEKKCPICGETMIHDGQDIPFQTFLGFHAEKTPDIDLNFPGDYQAKAHDYTKELLGADNVFRAGTIETVAEKTAFGFARGFIERSGLNPDDYPKAKIQYLASGCVDVKRTTGQHPGGIVVVPTDHEVYDFTPIQWPADEAGSAWKTTHFDFHSIHDTILKLDLLGHVDPMALKMMADLTHIDIKSIPMNDEKVLSLFSSNKALEMKHNYLGQKTGAMGIPEFGTEFVRGILEKTLPKTFSDLVIISGLSHGTDVWNGNAEDLIDRNVATLQEVIGCRDDIMTYLIDKQLPPDISFAIMEDVRKGRGLKPQYEEIMKAHNVPQYYLDSCNLIKYMFPKGHAVAYVTQAIRVGFFKIYYPLEYYATFFTVRSKQYDIEAMVKGEDAIIARLEELKAKNNSKREKLSPKESEQLKTLQIAIEMVQRGYKFANIDINKSDATKFIVDHENKQLIPPFITLDGLGENNAVTVIEARKKGPFISKENLAARTGLTQTNIEQLTALGALEGLRDKDQLTLFDF